MRNKLLGVFIFALVCVGLMSVTVYAGTWEKDSNGWWYKIGDYARLRNGWQWIDGNNDGIAECYYFDSNGYCLTDTTTPDGYRVNADGAWIENGTVKTMVLSQSSQNSNDVYSGTYEYQYNVSDYGTWKSTLYREPITVVMQDNDHLLVDGDIYTRTDSTFYGRNTAGNAFEKLGGIMGVTYISFDTANNTLIFYGEEEGDSYYKK